MTKRFLALLILLPMLAACSLDPTDMEEFGSPGAGMARLGRHLQEKGEYGGAIDFYRRALASDPSNRLAIEGLAASLTALGDKQGAADIYAKGVEARPRDIEMRLSYGRLLITLDNPRAAQQQFERALDVDDGNLKARNGLGIALDYLGEHRRAQKQYEEILDDEPGDLVTINNLAYSYILSNRYDKAIHLLEPQYTKPSATPALRQNLALAYGLAGMDADAQRIASMDLPPETVARNMDYYRVKRAELALSKAPYAELGTYATEALAIAQIQKLKGQMAKIGGDLRPVVLPEVTAPGGTPRFAVRMMGCSRPSDISRLCATLDKLGIPCVARGKGGE